MQLFVSILKYYVEFLNEKYILSKKMCKVTPIEILIVPGMQKISNLSEVSNLGISSFLSLGQLLPHSLKVGYLI